MKKTNPLFTICMPVYKSEAYIQFAIEDLLRQTFSDFECLVIDDKSPDNALSVAKETAAEDPRFVFMKNKKNLGVSATRNKGIEKAKGRYILFLDSDDRFDYGLLERISQQITEECSPDVITWEFGQVGPNEEKIKVLEGWREAEIARSSKPVGVYTPLEVKEKIFQVNINSMCVKAFRVAYLIDNNIKLSTSMKFAEDALFSHTATCLAKKIVAINDDSILYFYRRDQPDSAMHTIDMSSQMKDQLEAIRRLSQLLNSHDLYTTYQSSFNTWIYHGVGSIIHRITNNYKDNRNMIDAQIFSILRSRSWRITRLLRKNKAI